MVRPHTFIKLDTEEAEDLKRFMNTVFKERGVRARRRVQAIWFSHQGWAVGRISRHLRVSKHSIWKWIKAYKEKGLVGLKGKYFYRGL